MLNVIGSPLLGFVITTSSLILCMLLAVIFCCLWIRFSDLRWARRQNITLTPKLLQQPAPKEECCVIYVPDVAVMLVIICIKLKKCLASGECQITHYTISVKQLLTKAICLA